MGFRDEFWLTNKTYAEWSLENTTKDGFRANQERLSVLQKQVKSTFEQGVERLAESQMAASAALQGELAYQAERIGEQIAEGSNNIVAAVERGSADVVTSIQKMSDYLGSELCEVRWAIERQTGVSQQMLQVLLDSLSNESRQYFEQGVKCYETNESEFAKERFNKALESNRTNHFAYQYIGFLAVAEDNSDEAIKNFELARKFAETGYHQALALSHLARSYYALGNLDKASQLAKDAIDAHSQIAKFWYEFASYCAQQGYKAQAIAGLRGAIERDWTYWAVVTVDKDFDSMRVEVNRLLNEFREREKGKARQSLDNLKRAIDTAQKVGATNSLSLCVDGYNRLERQFQQNNVFLFRKIVPEADSLHESAFRVADEYVTDRVTEHQKQLNELQVSIRTLESKWSNTGSDYKAWNPNAITYLFVCGILWLLYVGVVSFILHHVFDNLVWDWGLIDGRDSNWTLYAILFAFLTSPIALFIPYTIDRVRFRKEVTLPRASVGDEIIAKRNEVEPQQRRMENELKLLKGYKERLHKKEYI